MRRTKTEMDLARGEVESNCVTGVTDYLDGLQVSKGSSRNAAITSAQVGNNIHDPMTYDAEPSDTLVLHSLENTFGKCCSIMQSV